MAAAFGRMKERKMILNQMSYIFEGNMQVPWFSQSQMAAEGPMEVHIICIGDEPLLLASRHQVLSKAGYYVVSCTSKDFREFPKLLDLVLICRSVPPGVAARITDEVRAARPQVGIIRLRSYRTDEGSHYDAMIDTIGGPLAFLAKLTSFRSKRLISSITT